MKWRFQSRVPGARVNQLVSAIGWDLRLDLLARFLTKQFEDDL
jgi:hypothetical protein